MKRFFALSLLGTALSASSAFAATILFTDANQFNLSSVVNANGPGPTFTENFNTNTSLFSTFNVQGSVNGLPGFSGGNVSGTTDGVRNTQVTFGYSEVITLNSGNMTAFGATWDLSPGGAGAGVNITIALVGGGIQVISLPSNNFTSEFFFGFTSDVAFTSVTLSQAGLVGSGVETFNIDDMLIEQAGAVVPPDNPPSGVPEPSTFGLMGGAMVGLGLIRKFRK